MQRTNNSPSEYMRTVIYSEGALLYHLSKDDIRAVRADKCIRSNSPAAQNGCAIRGFLFCRIRFYGLQNKTEKIIFCLFKFNSPTTDDSLVLRCSSPAGDFFFCVALISLDKTEHLFYDITRGKCNHSLEMIFENRGSEITPFSWQIVRNVCPRSGVFQSEGKETCP